MNTLTMNFKNKSGKRFSLRVQKVKNEVPEALVDELMDLIIEKNIFFENEKELAEKVSATINREESVF